MNAETEKIIREQMEKLPEEVRNLFANETIGEKIIEIGKRNSLNVEQLGILETETYLVMLGLVHLDDYPDELKHHLNIDDLKVNTIITETNREILSGIREKLKEAYEQTNEATDNEEEIKETLEGDTKILSSAGIEIINGGNSVPPPKKEILPVPEKLELNANPVSFVEKIESHPILAQKLSTPTQTTSIKTEHSLDNNGNTPPTTPYPTGSDPYRLPPV
ncbi:MAG: hypothetical protein WAV15_02395 [Minisyncoccia bacterium]